MNPFAFEDYRAGRIGPRSLTGVAEAAAVWLAGQDEPMAVCLSPTRAVTVELADEAADEDLVGVYSPGLGVLELYRRIRDDLRAEIEDRAGRAAA
ncbi:hypothetical protein ABE488_00790 [Luteimonas sp. TWI662]|uniref:hypothetical protein n=1 Tax=Luteimonas sp. TWI662 TaxID=3136789 RepID=UPI00320AD89D